MSDAVVERGRGGSNDHGHPRPDARIEVGAFGPPQTNAYLVWDGHSTDALVLDPGMGAAAVLLERTRTLGLRVHQIANSHGHFDHVFDNATLVRATGAPLAIHPDDEYRLAARQAMGQPMEPSRATAHLRDGEQVRVGELIFDVLHTPGHTEGSVCLYEERLALLLSGDTLFRAGWGRTDLPGGDDGQMIESLTRLAREIDARARVLPGHGEETTLERELGWIRGVAARGRLVMPWFDAG